MAPDYTLQDIAALENRVRDLEIAMAGVRGRLTVILMMLTANLAGLITLLLAQKAG